MNRSISTGKRQNNDFDYDLLSARFPDGQEQHGLSSKPLYAPDAEFNFETKQGNFQLAPQSPGSDQGKVIPSFCDIFASTALDMGAHEAGTPPMTFGVNAQFIPPGTKP